MHVRKLSVLILAALLAACASQPSSKYPYPPQFVSPDQVNVYTLPAPPQPGSTQYKHEIKDILAMQKQLTPEEIAAIQGEIHISPQMLVEPVLGEQFTPENLPKLYALLDHAQSDAWRIGDTIQEHWNETRPWLADARVKRYVEEIHRPGYPSGHTTTNTTWALILGDMMPQQQDKLVARASEIGHHRVEGGAHFPHDIEQGRKLAHVIYQRMQMSPTFVAERNAAQLELDAFIQAQLKAGVPMRCCTAQAAVPATDNDD